MQSQRILRISRVVSDLARSVAFYGDSLGFRAVAQGHADKATLAALGAGNGSVHEVVMQLGSQDIALVCFATPGRPYPPDSRSDDLWFQHLAIVVSGMDDAYTHLASSHGWHPISTGGPQLLPPANGSMRAFKFRDPDGHPLELLWLPPGQGRAIWRCGAPSTPFVGIEHTALSVASTRRSLSFYRALGLQVSNRSLNRGPAQTRLDGLQNAWARVTDLRPASATGPGLELLGYQPPGRPAGMTCPNDVLTDWVTLACDPGPVESPCGARDPEGHRIVLVNQGAGGIGLPARGPMT